MTRQSILFTASLSAPVNREEFEAKLLQLWVKSSIPFTEANLQYLAGTNRRKLSGMLRDLVADGFLESDEEGGQLVYSVPGSARPADGPKTFEHFERKQALLEKAREKVRARAGRDEPPTTALARSSRPAEEEDEDDGSGVAAALGKAALFAGGKALVALDKPLTLLDKPRGKGEKSLLWSGGLSLLGPLGWLYAGSFREAVPAILAFMAIGYILPSFMLMPLLWVALPASALVGLTYAWQYNRKGGRTPLVLKSKGAKTSSDESS